MQRRDKNRKIELASNVQNKSNDESDYEPIEESELNAGEIGQGRERAETMVSSTPVESSSHDGKRAIATVGMADVVRRVGESSSREAQKCHRS